MPPHPLTNFVFSTIRTKKNLMVFIQEILYLNLDGFKSRRTHWIALYVNDNSRRYSYDAIYFDSFGVECISKEIKKFIENKNIITNIYRIQVYSSIGCAYFCIGFIDFMLKDKSFLDYANLFSANYYEKNDNTILNFFQ